MGGQPSAKAHDSSMGLNRNIYSVHYTQMGFPILNQGRASGVSDSGKVGLFPFGGVSFRFAESQLPPHPHPKPSQRTRLQQTRPWQGHQGAPTKQNKAPSEGLPDQEWMGKAGQARPSEHSFRPQRARLRPGVLRQPPPSTWGPARFSAELWGQPGR